MEAVKPLQKTHSVQSLFEMSNYITVFDNVTGEAAGRIYKAKRGYLAMNLNTGKQQDVNTITQGEGFILLNRGGYAPTETREVEKYEVYKINDFGQRLKIDEFESERSAQNCKKSFEYREPGYSYKIIPVYREEKKQQTLFEI